MNKQKKTWESVYGARLLLVAEKLESLPKERFYFNHWVGDDWKGATDLSCGTTACALGWATTIPKLRELGLHLEHLKYINMAGGYNAITLRTRTGLGAAMELFNIMEDEAESMFIPGDEFDDPLSICGRNIDRLSPDATAKQVARRIRAFVKNKTRYLAKVRDE